MPLCVLLNISIMNALMSCFSSGVLPIPDSVSLTRLKLWSRKAFISYIGASWSSGWYTLASLRYWSPSGPNVMLGAKKLAPYFGPYWGCRL